MVARLVLRRVVHAVPLLLIVSVVVFLLIHAAPGGPGAVFLSNPGVRPEDLARLEHALGLDRPLSVQYVRWLGAFLRGDWGYSISDGQPVLQRILGRSAATAELVGTSLTVAALVSLVFGLAAALWKHRWPDRLVGVASAAGLAMPAFWFGLLLQLVFASVLGWLPTSGRETLGRGDLADSIAHLVLPATVLAALHAAAWVRYVRASAAAALAQPFVLAAHARGLPPARVVARYVARVALLPVVTVVLLDLALIVSGAVVTESVFAWPGLGTLFTEALARRDYPVLMAMLMLASSAVVILNAAADVLYAFLDPRVRA